MIASHESTGINDLVQVLFFIRIITSNFQCYEELLGLGTLTEKMREIDVLNMPIEKFRKTSLELQYKISLCTDGASSIKGNQVEFIALLQKELPNQDAMMSFHCILHQQKLWAKSALLNNTQKGVVNIANTGL